MMNHLQSNPIGSRVQRNWDWRAAGNFIGGGVGSGLVIWSVLMSPLGYPLSPLLLAGLGLVAAGLFCVWLEIGRPWRALNVLKHVSTSWMSREAWVAPLLFLCGLASWLFMPLLAWPAALLAGAFLYSQSRILQADKGIPAWRHPRAGRLVVVSGLTEGAGLLALLLPLLDRDQTLVSGLLLVLLGLRAFVWRHYLAGLAEARVPLASRKRLGAIDRGFFWGGHLLPALLLCLSFLWPAVAIPAGAIALLAGAWMKYTLITKAAFTQGFSLQHVPVRGQPPAASAGSSRAA